MNNDHIPTNYQQIRFEFSDFSDFLRITIETWKPHLHDTVGAFIWLEFSVIPGRIQMEWLISVECFPNKVNTFRGIPFFSLLPVYYSIWRKILTGLSSQIEGALPLSAFFISTFCQSVNKSKDGTLQWHEDIPSHFPSGDILNPSRHLHVGVFGIKGSTTQTELFVHWK